jgi:hypothetical protein
MAINRKITDVSAAEMKYFYLIVMIRAVMTGIMPVAQFAHSRAKSDMFISKKSLTSGGDFLCRT